MLRAFFVVCWLMPIPNIARRRAVVTFSEFAFAESDIRRVAFKTLRDGGRLRVVATLALFSMIAAVPRVAFSQAAAAPPACTASEYRQFDFWVGRWDVYSKKSPEKKVAQSLIERLYSGCAVRENWMPLSGGDGGSLNSYQPSDGLWHQTWTDSSGSWAEFRGKWNGTALVIEGIWPQPGHPKQRTRMTYTPLGDGSVEQIGESSDDEGKSWQPSFDLIYRPASEKKASQ